MNARNPCTCGAWAVKDEVCSRWCETRREVAPWAGRFDNATEFQDQPLPAESAGNTRTAAECGAHLGWLVLQSGADVVQMKSLHPEQVVQLADGELRNHEQVAFRDMAASGTFAVWWNPFDAGGLPVWLQTIDAVAGDTLSWQPGHLRLKDKATLRQYAMLTEGRNKKARTDGEV